MPARHSVSPAASIAAKLLPSTPGGAPVAAGQRIGVLQDVVAMDLVVEQIEAERRLRLRLAIQLPLKGPDPLGCCQAHRQSPILAVVESTPEVRGLPSAGVTRPRRYHDPVRSAATAAVRRRWDRNSRAPRASPDYPHHHSSVPCPPTPADRDGCSCRLLPHPARPSPNLRRVGIRDFTFEACSGFTRVTARWIAQPPQAAFVARLRPGRLPRQTACQLPDQTDNCLGGTSLH